MLQRYYSDQNRTDLKSQTRLQEQKSILMGGNYL